MHTITIHSRWLPDAKFSIPSQWEELSGEQLKKVAWLSRTPHQGPNLAKLFFMVLTESLPWFSRFRLRWFFIVSSSLAEKADLLFLCQTFLESTCFTEQKLPKIRLKNRKLWGSFVLLYGPSSKLGNATFWEYIQAEKYYLNYLDNPAETKWLDKLVATLYREQKSDFQPQRESDCRIPLTEEGSKWRLLLIERMPIDTKLMILMWFESCRKLILKSFPTLFSPPEETGKKKSNTPSKLSARERNGQHWLEMISELAGSMDRYDAIGNTLCWVAFTDITHKIKKSQEAKKQLAQARVQYRKR